MAIKIKIKRGLKANLPTLDEGELGLCTDTEEVFIGTTNGNVPFATKQELDDLQTQIDNLVINGGGTVVKDSVTNGSINVNGQEIQVYDDYGITTDITNLKTSQHTHTNKTALDRLNINAQNHLTIDGVELVTGGGSSVADSPTNGNILINGSEVKVYDDANVLNQIAGKQPSGDYATRTELSDGLSQKADTTNVYNKTEVDTKLASVSSGGSVDLSNYYSKTEIDTTLNDYATQTEVDGKVDKIVGKQLSTEDYTTVEKNKLAGVEDGANNYTHPVNHPPSIILQDSNNRFVTDLEKADWNAKVDKVTGKQLSTEDYTTAEKNKLANIETGAEVNTVTSVNGQIGDVVIELIDGKTLDFKNTNVARSISVNFDPTLIKQNYLGGYIEIQPDSWDGSATATDGTTKTWGFPFSLLPTERERIKNTVFNGVKSIMYIRFPLGFAYRGFRNIDSATGLAKNIGQRFIGQNATLRSWFDKISIAGGGLAPEYWCPPPYWVTSGSYSGTNQLRAGGSYPMTTTLASIKATDLTQYNAQIEAFTNAIIDDLEYLHQNIAPVRMFGLQNEPTYSSQAYGACQYDSQTYNDVLSVLYPKITASSTLSVYNDEKNEVKLLVASSDEGSPFTGIASTFISNHANWIWGYTHHSMRKASGESYSGGADWYKTVEFTNIKGSKTNVFINEYEYFGDYGTDEFRCANNMLHLINEAVYGEAQVLHPVIHICKPLGQTLASTNTRGYCLFAVNLNGEYGLNTIQDSNPYALNKGTAIPNVSMYNSWAMFSDNLPVGAYLVGDYTTKIQGAGWCAYKHNGKLYFFFANNSAEDVSISITFDASKTFMGKMYSTVYCGDNIKNKTGSTIEFVIPAYSGQAWIEQSVASITVQNVPVTGISLNQSTLNFTSLGQTSQLTATLTPSNATIKNVTWSSSNTNVVTVSSSGLVTVVGSGNATITVTSTDGGYTAQCSVTSTIQTVSVTGVSLNNTSYNLSVNNTLQLTATIAPSDASNKNITWSSSDPSIATVSSNGLVTGITSGSTIITVTTQDGGFTATCNLTVSNISVTGVTLDNTSSTLNVGQTLQLNATVLPSNAANKNVTWSSSNTSVATVDSNGLVTAISEGNAIISVTTQDGGFTANCSLSSTAISVTGISLNKSTSTLIVGSTEQLTVTFTPSNATNKNVTWSSSDPTLATVTNGLVTAIAAGTVTITATSVDGNFAATCNYTINDAPAATQLVYDSFDRTNSTTSLGNADTGGAWTIGYAGMVLGISNNKAYGVNTTHDVTAYIDSLNANVTVSVDSVFDGYSGISLRYLDDRNSIRLRLSSSGLGLFTFVNETATSIGSYAITPVIGTTYNFKAEMNGTSIKVYLNNNLVINASTDKFLTETKHGIFFSSSSGANTRYDNFSVTSI